MEGGFRLNAHHTVDPSFMVVRQRADGHCLAFLSSPEVVTSAYGDARQPMVEGDRAGILRQAHVGSHEHIMYDLFHIVGGNSSAYDTGDVRLISNNEVRIEVRLALKNQPK
jgi:hypothetical protein